MRAATQTSSKSSCSSMHNQEPARRVLHSWWHAATMACLLAAPANAVDYVDGIDISQRGYLSPPLRVEANADGYTKVLTSSVPYELNVSGSCTAWGKADQTDVWIYRNDDSHYRAKTIDWGWNRRDVSGVADISVELTSEEKSAVLKVCNDYLAQRISQGAQPFQILGQDQVIAGPKLYRARHVFGCTGNLHLTGDSATKEIDLIQPVKCQKAPAGSLAQPKPPRRPPPPGPQVLAVPFAVTEASLHAVPSKQTVDDDTTVKFQGKIRVNRDGLVQYRIRKDGALGPVQNLSFSKKGASPVQFEVDVACTPPAPGKTLKAPSGGGIGGLTSNSDPSVKKGSAQLVIVKPTGNVHQSRLASYTVICKKKSPAIGGALVLRLPDLVVLDFDLQGASGGTARIKNRGSGASASTNLKTFVTVNRRTQTFSTQVPALPAGATHDVKVLFPGVLTGQVTNHKIRLRVDDPDIVKESNELNNGYIVP